MNSKDSNNTPSTGRRKRPLTFVSEGVSDIETQKIKEEKQQNKYELERQRRNRKSLQDQLRSNAISKQREFKSLVRKKEKFNKLNKNELKYFNNVKEIERKKEHALEDYISKEMEDYDTKQRRLNIKKRVLGKEEAETEKNTSSERRTNNLTGVIVKKKKLIKLKKLNKDI